MNDRLDENEKDWKKAREDGVRSSRPETDRIMKRRRLLVQEELKEGSGLALSIQKALSYEEGSSLFQKCGELTRKFSYDVISSLVFGVWCLVFGVVTRHHCFVSQESIMRGS